jgi:Hemagglutinin repeat
LAGQDITIAAKQDIALAGGAIVAATRDLTLVAGRDLIVTALADTATSKSSNWGLSLDFNAGGVTVGGNTFRSESASALYTNAQLTAGGAKDSKGNLGRPTRTGSPCPCRWRSWRLAG